MLDDWKGLISLHADLPVSSFKMCLMLGKHIDIDSALKYYEKSWLLVEESLSLGVNLVRVSSNTNRRSQVRKKLR